jgi:general secretion pathway protein A
MYTQFFKLRQAPFSIAPDPRYLLLTHGHREALGHLMYGVNSGGGIVLLTGEIGAGKTTVCRCFLEQVPANCNVAYIFNPKLTVDEMLKAVCEEFGIETPFSHAGEATIKDYVDAINRYLLAAHAQGRNSVLIIDEAQNLSADVLEQLRLLTNLETNERKLLQIILIGQPELRDMLARPELKQLAQRIIARYHLAELSEQETAGYIAHRLSIAGMTSEQPFAQQLARRIHRITQGVPRRINLLCDRAMLGAYAEGTREVSRKIIDKAATEIFGIGAAPRKWQWPYVLLGGLMVGALVGAGVAWTMKTYRHPHETGALSASAASASASVTEPDNIERAALHDQQDAWKQLANAWGETVANGDFCAAAVARDLRCVHGEKGLQEIAALDRPAILIVDNETGQPTYLVLTGLTPDTATLQTAGATYQMDANELQKRFSGKFISLTREPHAYHAQLKSGDHGAEVDWLAGQLARINGEPEPQANATYDEHLARAVRTFQKAHDLTPDGRVGPLTLDALNQAIQLHDPRLGSKPAE